MPTPRVTAAAVTIGGKLHVIGGRNGTTYLNSVQAYDPVTNSWTTGASMPTARAALGAAGVGGFVYAVWAQQHQRTHDKRALYPLAGVVRRAGQVLRAGRGSARFLIGPVAAQVPPLL
jgi:hypothetical protein